MYVGWGGMGGHTFSPVMVFTATEHKQAAINNQVSSLYRLVGFILKLERVD